MLEEHWAHKLRCIIEELEGESCEDGVTGENFRRATSAKPHTDVSKICRLQLATELCGRLSTQIGMLHRNSLKGTFVRIVVIPPCTLELKHTCYHRTALNSSDTPPLPEYIYYILTKQPKLTTQVQSSLLLTAQINGSVEPALHATLGRYLQGLKGVVHLSC